MFLSSTAYYGVPKSNGFCFKEQTAVTVSSTRDNTLRVLNRQVDFCFVFENLILPALTHQLNELRNGTTTSWRRARGNFYLSLTKRSQNNMTCGIISAVWLRSPQCTATNSAD